MRAPPPHANPSHDNKLLIPITPCRCIGGVLKTAKDLNIRKKLRTEQSDGIYYIILKLNGHDHYLSRWHTPKEARTYKKSFITDFEAEFGLHGL